MFFKRRMLRLSMMLPLATAVACEQGAEGVTAGDRLSIPQQARLNAASTALNVTDVEQLYAAVNDPANEGAAIILAPGTYVLSASTAVGVARPNAGRLELQPDMSLYGLTGDRSAVVIDATGLPASSVSLPLPGAPTNRTAPLRIGRGNNTIEWLTVLGNPMAAAGIAAELPGTLSARVRVAHVVSGGTSRGVDVRSVGQAMAGRRIEAEIVDNELFGPSQVIGNSEGIRLSNMLGTDNSVIVAKLSGNRVHGFQLGCVVANNRSSNSVLRVRSSGDRFFANVHGCDILGGLVSQPTRAANANSTSFEAYGSEFVDNTAAIDMEPVGIVVIGGNSAQANLTSDNTVFVALWGSKVSNNLGIDFRAVGANQGTLSGLAGTNNHVTIELHGVSKQIDVQTTMSLPFEAAGTNTVTVIR